MSSDNKEEHPFTCTHCGKSFSKRYSLINHVHVHTGEKKYKCGDCEKTFSWQCSLTNHMRIVHTTDKPHQCECCSKRFSSARDLDRHMVCHAVVKPFKCTVCNRTFSYRTGLRDHGRVHTGAKPFSCMLCNKVFAASQGLNLHLKTVHSESEMFYNCEYCHKRYTHPYSLKRHLRLHTASDKKPNDSILADTCMDRVELDLVSVDRLNDIFKRQDNQAVIDLMATSDVRIKEEPQDTVCVPDVYSNLIKQELETDLSLD